MVTIQSGRQRKVFDRLSKKIAALVAVGILASVAWAQAPAAAPKGPAVKDQGEYDLTVAIGKEADPQKKLDLLKQWDQKYPESEFKSTRAVMTAQTEGAIASKGLQPNVSAGDADAANKAAKDLLDNVDTLFAPANKPATATDQVWADAKKGVILTAHNVLATIAMGKKNPEGDGVAETEFKKVLELAPDSAATAYQLGVLILRGRKAERVPEALYYIAHSISVTGTGALNAAGKKAADDYLARAYDGYHGSKDGLDDLKKAAAGSPTPPAGFTIESVTAIQAKQQGDVDKFNAEHPDLAMWRQIKGALTAADGDAYFDSSVKDAGLPPPGGAFERFKGKVVEQKSPSELVVNVDSPVGDADLLFESPLKGTIEVGTEVHFKGAVSAFSKEPYTLTFKDLGKEDVDGLPPGAFAATPPPRPKRPAPAKKK
jgi:hypothetical protein